MKVCTKCGESKPTSDFRIKAGRPYSQCKRCEYLYSVLYQKTPQGKRMKKEADRRYSKSPDGIKNKRRAKRRYKHTERGQAKAEEYRTRLRNRDPNRLRARMAVHHAVEAGILHRPECCSRCGALGGIEGHHHNGYEKTDWLNVIWLCRECHLKEHNNLTIYDERKETT